MLGNLPSYLRKTRFRTVSKMVSNDDCYEDREGEREADWQKACTEPPWNVILHNDWNNSMLAVVVVLVKVIPGMTIKRAARIMYEAHSTGQALVKQCHKELAELYEECLREKGLTASIEPGRKPERAARPVCSCGACRFLKASPAELRTFLARRAGGIPASAIKRPEL
jgi:ATP-dependent Clp protease adaptor protein ClpS